MTMKVKAIEKLKFSKDPNDPERLSLRDVARTVFEPEPEEGNQGGCPAQWREPGCDAGLLGCSR